MRNGRGFGFLDRLGVYVGGNGERYEGQWDDDTMTGRGKQPNQSRHILLFKQGKV